MIDPTIIAPLQSELDLAGIHNTLIFVTRLYGQLLAEQEKQIRFLRAQNDALRQHLAQVESSSVSRETLEPGGGGGVKTHSQRMAGQERVGEEPLGGQPLEEGRGGEVERSGALQSNRSVGQEERNEALKRLEQAVRNTNMYPSPRAG